MFFDKSPEPSELDQEEVVKNSIKSNHSITLRVQQQFQRDVWFEITEREPTETKTVSFEQ